MKTLYYLPFLLLLAFSQACKKDLGNYDYTNTDVPVVDTTGLGRTLTILRYSTIQLEPEVSIANGHSLQYQWLFYSRTQSSTSIPEVRELSTELKLDAFIGEPVGGYYLELIVTDQENDLKTSVVFNVDVSANMEYGMLVLYEGAAGGDVDFIKTPSQSATTTEAMHLKHLYSSSFGEYMAGTPKFVWSSRYSTVNWVTVASENYIARFHGDDFSFLRDQLELFRRNNTVIKPEAYVYTTSYYNLLINNGRMHLTNSTAELDAKFGGDAAGNYRLAPYLSEAVSSYPFIAVGYDELNGRFLYYFSSSATMIDFAAPANSDQKFDLRNIGKDMLYMTSGASSYTYSFFKDRTGNGRWLYVTNFSGWSDNGLLAINAYEMTGLPEIDQARFYQVSGLASFAYYATADKIYNYAYASSGTANVAFTVPSGEEITSLKLYRPRPRTGLFDREERVLYLATWNGSIGKVYELSINETSGVINPEPLHVFEVEGKVADMSARVR